MLDFLKKRRIKKYIEGAAAYINDVFEPESNRDLTGDVKFSLRDKGEIQYSLKRKTVDAYSATGVSRIMKSCAGDKGKLLAALDDSLNQSFVERLIFYINRKGVKDSMVYKAAHVDKRLFSKIMSDRQYKPAKDTAIALALGLRLTLEETNDLLSRAGYIFSHSDKRDVVIEYFFREGIFDLMDINDVLHQLDLKIIGRM